MTQDGWRALILKTAQDPRLLELLAQLLAEQDRAKARLAELGYGCLGMPWPAVVDEIAQREQ